MTRRIFLSCVSLLFGLFLLEVGLRAMDAWQGLGFFRTNENKLSEPIPAVKPFRTFGFDPYRTVNGIRVISDTWKRQFALPKPAGVYRIVCFGGSTTAHRMGAAHYPHLLQQMLREATARDDVEVINVGNAAYATSHSIILLVLDVLSWHPDMVILSHNINDLTAIYFPGIRPDYWNKYQNPFYSVPDISEHYRWSHIVFQHSRLYWYIIEACNQSRMKKTERNVELVRKTPFDPGVYEMGRDLFRRNVQTFVDIAQARKIEVVLGTQPHEPSEAYFMRHMAHKPYNDVSVYPSHAEHLKFHAGYNSAIREVAQQTGAILVDNEPSMNGETSYFIDHVHNSAEGLYRLAQNYAAAIMEHHQGR